MAFTNNVMIVRHGLLAKLVKLWKENRLLEEIDRLPIELSPRKSKVRGRCCVHKERAVWKYKTLPLLGFDMQDEEDELTPLSEYAKRALFRSENKKENIMCVVDEACSSCVSVNYEITNLCRGCVARSCYMNCPKDAMDNRVDACQGQMLENTAEVCRKSDVVISAVPSNYAVTAAEHALDGIKEGQPFMDVSTATPIEKKKISGMVKAKGGLFVAIAVAQKPLYR